MPSDTIYGVWIVKMKIILHHLGVWAVVTRRILLCPTPRDCGAPGERRVIVLRWRHDLAGAGEEKENCRLNDVSVVSCYKPSSKSRLRSGGRSLPRRKVSKRVHRRDQDQEQQQQRNQAAVEAYDSNQPPTDYYDA
uniref:Uncharacterized protein n=1 Tax=Oryza punctata TaxID=4537 RepID=A0A0E0K3L5_ORYPU